MKKNSCVLAGVLCSALALCTSALARNVSSNWSAILSGTGLVPAQAGATSAHGQFKGSLSGTTLKWTLTISKLKGAPTFATIRIGANGKSAKTAVSLCTPMSPGATPATAGVPQCSPAGAKGTSTVSAAVLTAATKHHLWVVVDTVKNPNGALMGSLTIAPQA